MAEISPLAGKPADASILIDVAQAGRRLLHGRRPDPSVPAQRVGVRDVRTSRAPRSTTPSTRPTSSRSPRRSASTASARGSTDRCSSGIDTHALSEPAFASALEVLAANGVEVMVDARDGYTPTPVISHAVLAYNRGRRRGLADGIVITPSHNPPRVRRLQVRSAARRSRRHARHAMDRGAGERVPRRRTRAAWRECRSSAPALRRPRIRTSTSTPTCSDLASVVDLRGDSRQQSAHRRGSAGRRQRRLLGRRSASATGSTSRS